MHVYSKILKGTVSVVKFSTDPKLQISVDSPVLIKHEKTEIVREGLLFFTDDEYNLHEITATKYTWMLDVMDVYGSFCFECR
jgi:hypothetical protein